MEKYEKHFMNIFGMFLTKMLRTFYQIIKNFKEFFEQKL